MKKSIFAASLCASALAGCAPPPQLPPINTPTGQPEVFIQGKTADQIADAVISHCSQKGMTIDSQTKSQITCGRTITDVGTLIAYGANRYAPSPTSSAQFTIVQNGVHTGYTGQGYILRVASSVTTYNGFGASQRNPVMTLEPTSPAAHEVQDMLEEIKAGLQ